MLQSVSQQDDFFFSCAGLVLNPDLESESEDSEPDGPDDPVIPSPEMDDVKGESFLLHHIGKLKNVSNVLSSDVCSVPDGGVGDSAERFGGKHWLRQPCP